MIISLDYDNVYKFNESFCHKLINLCKEYDHQIKLISLRYEFDMGKNIPFGVYSNDDILQAGMNELVPVVFTNGKQRAEVLEADIYIDESPIYSPRIDDMLMQTTRLVNEE